MIWQKFRIKVSKWRKEDSIGINRKINIFKIVNTNFEFFLFFQFVLLGECGKIINRLLRKNIVTEKMIIRI